MEASGTPRPPSEPAATPPPPPPPPVAADDDRASGGWRAIAVLLALALAFAGAVMIAAMIDISDKPTGLAECVRTPGCTEYFDGTSAQKAITVALGFACGGVAAIGVLFSLYFVFTGRRGRTLLQIVGAAVVLGVLSIVIGSV
jgi:hypothetical protein